MKRRMPYEKYPPLRSDPFESDSADQDRIDFADRLWRSQDLALVRYARQVEENVRMLFGDQWIVWSPMLGQFLDLNAVLGDEEQIWRQRPIVNRLLFWFMLTHSRLTENPPVLTFRPGPDRLDRVRAEAADTIHKILWEETGMLENLDMLMAWLIPGGQAFLMSRIDPRAGGVKEFRGPADIPIADETGEVTGTYPADDVPFDQEGQPLARFDPGRGSIIETGQAFQLYEGGVAVDVLSPLECRGEWGAKPWHKKRWHERTTYLTPEEVFDTFGVEVEPDTRGHETQTSGELQRLMFGSGWYGAVNDFYDRSGGGIQQSTEEMVQIRELWMAPSQFPGMERQVDPGTGMASQPGGRLMITTRNQVLRDGPRPADFYYTSPIRCFKFLYLPGRPAGSTPQEAINPLQRQYNRGYSQIAEHTNLLANPIMVIDQMTGIQEGDIDNAPAQQIIANIQPHVPPILFVPPPPLGTEVFKYQDMLRAEMQDLGNIEGAEGRVPTSEASGQLVKELRFNSDRFIGPTLRRAVQEMARMAEDWLCWTKVLWTEEKILSYTGEDNIARTITITPDLFTGKVNIIPDLESMLPEGRGERQARVHQLWLEGAYGPPESPEAVRKFMEIARFPHMAAAHRPGGVHRETAQSENARLALGEPALAVPIFEWYDHLVHLETHEEFMASQEFLRLDPLIQSEFANHRQMHMMALVQQVMEDLMRQSAATAGMPPPGAPNGNGGGPGGPGGAPPPAAAARGGAQPPPDGGGF